MQIKDVKIEFEGSSLSKYGLFALLAWYLVDILQLEKRFQIVTVKKKRNRKNPIKRRRSPFPASKLCVGIVVTILLGIKRFERINNLLHTETQIANMVGLEKFFDRSTARNFINEFNMWHLNQLDHVNAQLFRDFGESSKQDFPILDIDTTTHSVESRKREKAIAGYNKKNKGKPCYQWLVGFVRGEIITQKLNPGNRHHCFKDFKEIVLDAKEKLDTKNLIIRADAGNLSYQALNLITENQFQIIIGCSFDYIISHNEIDESQWFTYDEKTKLLDLGLAKVVSKTPFQFRVILVEKEQENIKIKSRKKYYRYAIVTNLTFLSEATALYEFYNERQTIENFFKESKNPFNSGKIPSQKFRGNQAYLYLVAIAYNCFSIFKKNICLQSGREKLLRHLRIK